MKGRDAKRIGAWVDHWIPKSGTFVVDGGGIY